MRITGKIDVFNCAFPLAWCQITSPADARASSELSVRLAGLICRLINAGIEEAQMIADADVAQLHR